MTKYTDGTELPEVNAIPAKCPLCTGELVTRWYGVAAHGRRHRTARAFPLRVCLGCKIAVQVRMLPYNRSLHATRGAARAAAAKENEARNAREVELARKPF